MDSGSLRLGLLDPALDFANGVQIMVDLAAVAGPEAAPQAGDILGHPIEDAGVLPQFDAPFGRAAAIAEEAFEDDTRVGLGGKRRRRRRPGEIVLIRAGEAVIAIADRGQQIHAQLERRQRRVFADVLRGDLVDRRAELVIRAFGHLGLGGAEEGGIGGRVIAGE